MTSDPRLRAAPQREPEYYASRSEGLKNFITAIGYTTAVIMAIGAVFGALNTMYAAVATRSVGGLFPAVRAARQPVVDALRAA